jgi:hypothetical protein
MTLGKDVTTNQETSQVLCSSTHFPCQALSLSSELEVPRHRALPPALLTCLQLVEWHLQGAALLSLFHQMRSIATLATRSPLQRQGPAIPCHVSHQVAGRVLGVQGTS